MVLESRTDRKHKAGRRGQVVHTVGRGLPLNASQKTSLKHEKLKSIILSIVK